MGLTCLVCGSREEEVSKMHYFPANLDRSRIWQEKLGMRFTGETLRNQRICSKHFERKSYLDLISYRLRRDAIPISYENMPSSSQSHVRPPDVEHVLVIEQTCTENVDETCKDARPTKVNNPAGRKLFRNIENFSKGDSTPRKAKLVKIIHSKEDHLRKLKKLCRKRLHCVKALSNLTESSLVKNIFKDMSSVTANFMVSQIRNSKVKGAKGRRWNLEDKILALCVFKRSPRCYSLLRKFVYLPHKRTLLNMLGKVTFEAGINPHIFRQLKDKLPIGIDRCCLLFDEIDIQENVQYDKGTDRIVGFEDFGDISTSSVEAKPANKALVFMLVGLTQNWKQPVAFFFSNNGCKSSDLQKCIFDVLNASKVYAGLDVVVIICDMGVSNVKCLKDLGVTIATPFFFYEGRQIYAMYDPPHLLKCTYSLFRQHNMLLPVKIGNESASVMEARFSDIKNAYEIDVNNSIIFRTLHKIKPTHIKPVMRYAMKVCVAAQIFSHTVAAFLYSLVSSGILEGRVIATATFVKEVDTLFDSFNGRTNRAPEGKDLRCAISEESKHLQYWQEVFNKINNWTFKRLDKRGRIKKSRPPSQRGWLTSLNAIRGVWAYMKNMGASSLRPRSLNQGPLENLFGSIRYGCGCNDHPNCKQFIGSLKTQILNGLTNQATAANCEEDDSILLSNLKVFLNVEKETKNESDLAVVKAVIENDQTEAIIIEEISDRIFSDVSAGNVGVFSVAYVAGFIIKSIFKQIDCEVCKVDITSNDLELHNVYISNKEWTDSKNSLIYPSQTFTAVVGSSITTLELFLKKNAAKRNVLLNAENYLKTNCNFEWLTCISHQKLISHLTIRSVCKIGIPWWCKRKNQDIKETRKEKRANKRKLNKFKR